VNCVVPGLIDTVRSSPSAHGDRVGPLGRRGQPEEVAAAAAFLVSDDATYVTGETLGVSGGLGMV
jgi:NAD(P)-dependent dehydrogenase (short-subunit alcohol dehydrogenase family)